MANTKNLDSKLQSVKYTTAQIVEEINKLKVEGKSATEVYAQMNSKIEDALKGIAQAGVSVKKSYDQLKKQDPSGALDQYIKNLQSLAGQFQKVESQQTKIFTKAEKERSKILRSQQNLRNKIAAGNKERSKQVNDFEKKQLDRRTAYYKKKEKEKVATEKAEKAKRDRLIELEVQNSISKFKKEAAAHKKSEQEKTREEKRQKKERDAQEKKNDFKGGFRAQLTPRAIGGALGSLTKYLGLYQGISLAIGAIKEATIGSAKEAIEFEKSLANLSAVAGVSGDKVAQFGNNAKEVAAKTQFTAQEIVGLQTELSKLGFTSDQVIASTKAIAFTAQALGSPLNATAETVGKVINQFNLLAEQSTYVGDVIVTAINESALSFDTFNTAIQYVGPIADRLGLSLEQTAGAMAVLADNGFTASRIGTGLRGILTEISKTSFDAEQSLYELAKQNIGLSEAIDLVGKRNAAQLAVLLDNIDAIKESENEYYKAGRAIKAAAEQTDTFDGQLKILNSTIKNFQIEIGNTLVESNLFTTILSTMSDEAGRTVRSMKAIKNISNSPFGFTAFEDAGKRVAGGFDSLTESMNLLKSTGQLTEEQYKTLGKLSIEEIYEKVNSARRKYLLWGGEENRQNMELYQSVYGLKTQLDEQANTYLKSQAITDGAARANTEFGESIKAIGEEYNAGNDVVADADVLYEQVKVKMQALNAELKTNSEASIENKTLTERMVLGKKAEVKELEGYLNVLANISSANKDRNKEERENQFKLDLDSIKKARQAEIDFLNERAKIETALANGDAEKIADIEAERRLLVAQAYAVETDALKNLTKAYPDFIDKIEDAIDKSEKLSNVKTSEMMATIQSAAKDYADQIKELNEQLKAGTIDTDEYNSKRNDLFDGFQNNINAFRDLLKDAPEVLAFFDDLLEKTLGVGYISPYDKKEDDKAKKEAEKAAKEELKRRKKLAEDIARQAADVAKEYNKTILENKKAELDAELDAIRNKYRIENDILKSNLDNQLITESQFRAKSEELRKKQLQAENQKNEEIFKAEKKADQANIAIETIEALASNTIENFKSFDSLTATGLTAAGNAVILASGALKMDAVRRRKFYGVKFEEGGMVEGPSHSQGGIPFTVQGQTGYEMEGGEFIVNKKAAGLHRQLLESINNSVKPNASIQPMKFATGGMVSNSTTNINGQGKESVNYLKAIAEATTSTAIQSNKPVRAFISNKDLRTNETERRLRERNDRI